MTTAGEPLRLGLLLALLLGGCAGPVEDPVEPRSDHAATADGAPYAFDRPDRALELPGALLEVSGLGAYDAGRLAAVDDETGVVFVLDARSGAVVGRIPFGADGDYEGVERVGDRLFVLRSDGTLLAVSALPDGTAVVAAHETGLSAESDTEGLALDAAGNRLLIAAKRDPGGDLDPDRHRAVHAFDLASETMVPGAALVLDLDALESALGVEEGFSPSGLAVHPESGALYVLSSRPPALAELSAEGTLLGAWTLPPDTFEQPEGIAFLPTGELLIASEGVDHPARLFLLRPRRGD